MMGMRQAAATTPTTVTYENLWVDGRWLRNATVSIDATGNTVDVSTTPHAAAEVVSGLTLP